MTNEEKFSKGIVIYKTEDDLFAIYSCLMVKAQKRMNENLDKLIDSMV